jgi:hypothetical protein
MSPVDQFDRSSDELTEIASFCNTLALFSFLAFVLMAIVEVWLVFHFTVDHKLEDAPLWAIVLAIVLGFLIVRAFDGVLDNRSRARLLHQRATLKINDEHDAWRDRQPASRR